MQFMVYWDSKMTKQGQEILHKVIETAVDIASKKDKDLGINIIVCMTESDGSERFIALDGGKYGKNSVQQITDTETYSQGIVLDIDKLSSLTGKSAEITECNKIGKILNGSLLIQITIPKGTKADVISKRSLRKELASPAHSSLLCKSPICGNCGFKDEKLGDKCPACKSTYII